MRVRGVCPGVWAVLSLLVLLAGPSILAAQGSTGVVRGVVSDTTGAPLAGATVTILNVQTNASRSITTNTRGSYVATLLQVGTYQVSVRLLGNRPQRRDNVRVGLGEATEVNFRLQIEAVQVDEISVSAETPFMDPTRVAASTTFDAATVAKLPVNGRNYIDLMVLTPNVAIVQGPDGDEISVSGQKGIHNNVSVDGADFNNPFFGEQRGGQRPAFTFNLDALEEMDVVSGLANAEFGRSGGGFVNLVTKSGTNELHGTAHYFGQLSNTSADYSHTFPSGLSTSAEADFQQSQFGFTLGGPIVRDKLFFFVAYDQQVYDETKQAGREEELSTLDPNFATLTAYLDTAFAGALIGDFGAISRTNDANALLAKIDWRLNARNSLSLKYNYTNSSQVNGTFDVAQWGQSSNGLEKDYSHAINGLFSTLISNSTTNEFRFQYAREDRPRDYEGADNPATGRPFPDTDISFAGYRIGMPFFLPVTAHDTRIQLLDNVSWSKGNHLFKAGAEWNRTEVNQTFLGFANGRMAFSSVNGFIGYAENGSGYLECSPSGTPPASDGTCPIPGDALASPVVLYLQQAGVGSISVEEAGTQTLEQNEYAFFLQDSWKARPNLTVDYGLRWEALINPDPITDSADVFYSPLIGQVVTNGTGTYEFPSDGNIPSDKNMWQPRLGIAWDVNSDGKSIVRAGAGIYYARLAGLNLASVRSTNGSRGQTLAAGPGFGTLPDYGELVTPPAGDPDHPNVFVIDKDWESPQTLTASFSYERELSPGFAASLTYTHASTDNLTRFVNRNDAVFGSPWSTGIDGANGLGSMTTVESSAKSRYNGFTIGLRRATSPNFQFELNYTLSYDKSDDDNERDPFTLTYARADSLQAEYNWSNRDQRHRFNAWIMTRIPWNIYFNNRISAYSAQPTSEACGTDPLADDYNEGTGVRAGGPSQRICPDGHILQRNTIRKDNAFFTWDVRLVRPFPMGKGSLEAIVEVFNLFNTDNYLDPQEGGLFLNFDGTIRSGYGQPRVGQAGLRYAF